MVKLLYFMKLADTIGYSHDELKLPEDVGNIAELLSYLGQRGELYRAALGTGQGLQITINKKFVEPATAFNDGDEIAFFPKAD
jgi:sulfur-carrier protein